MLQTPTLRILYPKGVSQEQADAALKGVSERFARFGLMCEAAQVGMRRGESIKARDVYAGEQLVSLVTMESPVISAYDLHCESFIGSLHSKRVFGLGITDRPLRQMPETEYGRIAPVIGVAYPGRSGIVSISGFEALSDEEALKAIGIAAGHEAGHVLGRFGHCEKPDCVMGQNTDREDFIQRFVRQGRELCRDCARTINASVSSAGCRMG